MDYYDLGNYSRPVTTNSAEAQRWFDRGLIWIYAYHHEEAILCFQKALEADNNCAMAHWGVPPISLRMVFVCTIAPSCAVPTLVLQALAYSFEPPNATITSSAR